MRNYSIFYLCLIFFSTFVQAEEDALPELQLEEIEAGVYMHTSYEKFKGWGIVASNGLVVVENKNAYIIDTPSSEEDTKKLVLWIKAQGLIPKGSISTHFHRDSSGGIPYLNTLAIPTYASAQTNALIGKDGRELAKHTFNGPSFWLIKDAIEIFYPGGGHTQDNVVVWLPKKKVLFGGCFVKPKSLGNLSDAVLSRWPKSTEALISRYSDVKTVVPGHGKRGGISLLTHTKKLALERGSKNTPPKY